MIILEFIGRIFVELIFRGIILGIYELLKKIIEFIKIDILGFKRKPKNIKEILDKKLLYKEFELLTNINPKLKKGQKGVILEILDKKNVYTEFLDEDGKQIEYNNETVFMLKINQIKVKA